MNAPANNVRRVAFGDFPSWTKMIRPNIGASYAASFVDLANTELGDFDAIVPVQLDHYAPLMRYPGWRGHKFIHPAPSTISLCDDKLGMAQFLIAHGFNDYVPPLRKPGPPYPYIRKKRHGWWGMQCQIINGPQSEQNLGMNDKDWFIQAFIPGKIEFATHILRHRGQIRYASTFSYKMATEAFVKGAAGTPLNTRFHPGCMYLDLFSEILAALDYEGTACIDYKVVDRRPMLFEINPRFGGSLSLDITAYLDAYLDSLS